MRKLYTNLLPTLVLLITMTALLSTSARGQVLAWDLNGNATFTSTTTDANLNGATLTRGAGLTTTSLAGAFTASGWVDSTRAQAETNNRYFEFIVSAKTGWQVSLSTLDAWFRRSATGPIRFQWKYSLQSDFSSSAYIGDSLAYSGSLTGGEVQPQITLSGISALQNVPNGTSIIIRLYGWHASNIGGTFGLGRPAAGTNSLALGGAVTAFSGGGGPSVTANPTSLSGFTTITGTASASQNITVSGATLTDGITIAVTGAYEYSTDGGSNYTTTSTTLPQTGGAVGNTTVQVRIVASAGTGAATGSIGFSSGTASQSVSLSGTVNSTVAAPQSLTATPVSGTEIDLTGTGNAAGDNILVAYNTSATFGTPSGALTAGSAITGGGTVLYNGSAAGFSFQHTGLNPSAKYFYSAWSVDASNDYSSSALTASATTSNPPAATIVINQIYGGGGNSGATYKNDFIELYNNSASPVDLNGWSVQYINSAGPTATGSWSTTPLHGTIPAHGFFLIQESAGAAGTVNLPAPDVLTGSSPLPSPIAMSATGGKVILCNTTVAVVGDQNPSGGTIRDKVGYGPTATGFEGAPTDATTNTTAIRRVTDGVDNDNNKTDFILDAPQPRNSTYTVTPPHVASFNPPNGTDSLPYNYPLNLIFDKKIVKGTGNIRIYQGGSLQTTYDVNSANITISNNNTLVINTTLAGGKDYAIQVDPGAIADVYSNAFAGILDNTTWAFSTFDGTTAMTLPVSFDLSSCTGTGLLPDGFTQFNVTGDQLWDCTTFGRYPANNALDTAFGHAIQINGFANNADHLNEDWLISPKFDLTATNFPLLSFWSRTKFAGDPLALKISTDYSGTGDPALATWTDLNGKFPATSSDTWTQSININLSAYKQGGVYLAWVYRSTTDDGSRWSLDDIAIVNSLTPPPPTLTLSTNNIQLGYSAAGSTVTKKMTVTGNDLTGDITLTTGGGFLISPDSVSFGTTMTLGHDTANNVAEPVYVRFAPAIGNTLYSDTVQVSISDSTTYVDVKGNSIDPASTLNIVDWNLNWFGTPEVGFGVTDKNLQRHNVGVILPQLKADIYALQEVVDSAGMAAIVATMPGYAWVINNYGSHSNLSESGHYDLTTIQRLAFIYNTAKVTNIHTDSLFSIGVNTPQDTATSYYNNFASGRFPYMMTADVTLSDNNGGTIQKQLRLINLHAKANTGDIIDAYKRRRDGSRALDSVIRNNYTNDNVILLGDYNDDLNKTITTGMDSTTTSYSAFTIDHPSNYIFPTKLLSQQGQHSDVNYSSVIDNVIVNQPLAAFYLPNSATVLSDVENLVAKYGTTTTDHYPVFTQMSFTPPTPLPVKLLSFTATKQGQQSRLSWATSEETNSASFGIERSSDGVIFKTIGTVAAKGYSRTESKYSFIDPQPLKGTNYYRLKQIDLDEHFEYSRTVTLDFSGKLTVRVSPNPVHGTVYLTVDNLSDKLDIQILDLSGRIVKELQPAGSVQNLPVDLSALGRGIYTVKVVTKNSVSTQKLLLQ